MMIHSCVKLLHVKHVAMICLLVWVILQSIPQLSSTVQSHVLTPNMFGSAACLRYATTSSCLPSAAKPSGVL